MTTFLRALIAVLLWLPLFAVGFIVGVICDGLHVGWLWGESSMEVPDTAEVIRASPSRPPGGAE